MPSEINDKVELLGPEERIYDIALNKDDVDWKGLLHQLIRHEGLDMWDIDLGILTNKYLETLKTMKTIDFDISGKLLTIAVFLLKTKAELLVERDLRGIEKRISEVENITDENMLETIEGLQDFDLELNQFSKVKPEEKYVIKIRNPLARKRKVNIFDLIKTLEKTFEQSNKRRLNFLARHPDLHYDGPIYEVKPKDIKTIIDELHKVILEEFSNKKGHTHISFSHLTHGVRHKKGILDKFIPLLHLHNQAKIVVTQEQHFGEIKIELEQIVENSDKEMKGQSDEEIKGKKENIKIKKKVNKKEEKVKN